MSWLDDMEAADPAYPGPDADPWAAPAYVPDTARGLPAEVGSAMGEWARQQNARTPEPRVAQPQAGDRLFTLGEAYQVAEDAVGLFLEYRDTHGRAEDEARIEALGEVAQGLHSWDTAAEALNPHHTIGRDWRALREAETQARDAGLRVTVPQPDGQGSPEYQADAGAWGSGRGIGPDGPEVG
jgi:hypothetical protein